MMIKRLLASIQCVGILLGCSHSSNNIPSIKVTDNYVSHIPIEELFGEVTYVTLSSNEEILPIGIITGAFISKEKIYISDSKSIYIIDKNGSLINTINRYGRSLQEYLGISDFCVQNDEYIYILDKNKRIIKYNIRGEYIASSELEYYPASMDILGVGNLILTSAYQSDEDKFIIYDCNTLNKLYSFLPINQKQTTWRHIYGQSNFYHFNDEILFHEPMNNCIYQVRNSSLTPRLQFDILGRNLTEQFLNSRFSSIMDANTAASKNLFCFGIPIYAENDDLIWFTYRDGDNYRICKYDKNSKQSEQSDNLRFAKLFLSLPVADIFIHSESESAQMFVLTGDQIDPKIKTNILKVPENYDNLVFVFNKRRPD